MKNLKAYLLAMLALACLQSCSDDDDAPKIHNVSTADKVAVDRFSATAGKLMVRDATNGLPAANSPINFDLGAPFITKGKGPAGQNVEYYNFDVQSAAPTPIYALFAEGSTTPVPGQLNIIDVLPGELGYNDFWLVTKVTVPTNYQANEVASVAEIQARGYSMEATTTIVNCPVVPEGSTATKRLAGPTGLIQGWYKEKIVHYFTFDEKALMAAGGNVPTSPIYVSFNSNISGSQGGPASGFKTEPGTAQTHNVVATIPSNASYSPFWVVNAYDNSDFDDVDDLTSALNATPAGTGLALVNCPVVSIQ